MSKFQNNKEHAYTKKKKKTVIASVKFKFD